MDKRALEQKKIIELLYEYTSHTKQSKKDFSFPRYEKPTVSIVVVTFNQLQHTIQCFESLQKYTNVPYELIIVDNGSRDETKKFLHSCSNISVIENIENKGFPCAANQGAERAQAPYLLFLNNDTVVTHEWLEPMLETIEKHNAGIVGPKLLYPDGRLQGAGGIIMDDGVFRVNGRNEDPDNPLYNREEEVQWMYGTCMLISKDIFTKTGGFDTTYYPAYFEDNDLSMKVLQAGYKIFYQPHSKVYHYEGVSSTQGDKETYLKINGDLFYKRWRRTQ